MMMRIEVDDDEDEGCNVPDPQTGEEDATTRQNIWASSPMNMYIHMKC